MQAEFVKYPRTYHLADILDKSELGKIEMPQGQRMLVEEKMDGTQVGISLDANRQIQIQSRGQWVTSKAEFSLLKQWCWQHYAELAELLGQNFILFGEWLYAKHSMFYDCLPDYLMEFDIYHRASQSFLSTKARRQLLKPYGFIHSVKVLDDNTGADLTNLQQLIGASSFTSNTAFANLPQAELAYTDLTGLMEGLYIKFENEHKVLQRYKLIRPDFIQRIVAADCHWQHRELIKNQLGKRD